MWHFEKFVTEGNEKAGDLARTGAMLDEVFMAEARAETMQQEREEVYAAWQYAASSHHPVEQWKDRGEHKPKPKEKWTFVDQKREETKHRTEWCAEASRYRRMRCGKSKQIHEDARKMRRTKNLSEDFGRRCKQHLAGHDMVRRMDRQREVLLWCRNYSGYARQ